MKGIGQGRFKKKSGPLDGLEDKESRDRSHKLAIVRARISTLVMSMILAAVVSCVRGRVRMRDSEEHLEAVCAEGEGNSGPNPPAAKISFPEKNPVSDEQPEEGSTHVGTFPGTKMQSQ